MSVKLQDIQSELRLPDKDLSHFLRQADIRVPDNVKRISDKDARRLRALVTETRRREQKRQEVIAIPPLIAVRELADRMELPSGEVIKQLLKNGMVVNVNEEIDYETAAIIASDLGYTTKEDIAQLEEDVLTQETLQAILTKEDPAKLKERPPVVTVIGHIDHGKSTLVDAIRNTDVKRSEAGGITQHITSYQVQHKRKPITFIDTPGHEVFEFMRKRGASLADIGILVVAADDGVMAQTKEAIKHAKESGIPVIVAITKMDLPTADPEKVKRQLSDAELLPEEYGGDIPVVPVSAVTGQGIPDLLETILLMAEMSELKTNPDRPALGTVIEAHHDAKIGALASVLVQAGTLRQGDHVAAGRTAGSARQILDFNGKQIREAAPGTPCTIIGLGAVPNAGDVMQVVEERAAARKKAALARRATFQEKKAASKIESTKQDAAETMDTRESQEEHDLPKILPVILNADAQGSLEAIQQTVNAMGTDDVSIKFVRASVGTITESDIMAAEATNGIVLGFNVNIAPAALRLAETNNIPVARYSIIYELTEDIRKRLEDLLPTEVVREDLGTLKVLKVFFKIRGRQILGGKVDRGIVKTGEKMEAHRDGKIVAHGTITEVQQNRAKMDEIKSGSECGITYEGEGRVREGDIITVYREETRKRTL